MDLTSTVLKVPAGSKDVYSNVDGWNDFWNIEEFYYDRYFYVNYIVDDLLFARDSIKHGAEVILIEAPTKEGYTFSGWSEAPIIGYNISAYATLAGYENSDIATATLCWIEKESVSTDIIEVMSSAVLITCKDGRINICCGQDGAEVLVYDINGTTIGGATIINGNAILATSLLKGEIAIVNIAGKGIKVVMQ